MNRKEKIEMLREILQGKRSVKDLLPKRFRQIVRPQGIEVQYFIDGKPALPGEYEAQLAEQIKNSGEQTKIRVKIIDSDAG